MPFLTSGEFVEIGVGLDLRLNELAENLLFWKECGDKRRYEQTLNWMIEVNQTKYKVWKNRELLR